MTITVVRKEFTESSTIGDLLVDGEFECFTLEGCVRPAGGTRAIPAGTYEIVINFSERFKRPLPLLLKVPDFEGVRIHPGNTSAKTEGCILVGREKQPDFVGESRTAFETLFNKMQEAAPREKIFIELVASSSDD